MSQLPTRASVAERAFARLGTVVRKYRIGRLIGIGGMAAVYAATHRNGNCVAIKYLHADLTDDPDLRQLFKREAYVANQIGHPGAVPVLDDDEDEGGCPFLVMPLLEGETLRTRWQRAEGKRLSVPEVAVLMSDAIAVLASAHEKGIVHRDVKPDNLFVTDAGVVRVLDFGIARRPRRPVTEGEPTVTLSGRMMGAPAFLPPEQAIGNGDAIGPHTDCWAAGATIFALLSGEFVHRADSVGAQLVAAATQRARSFGSVLPGLPEGVARFIDKALAFDPADRWRNAGEMHRAMLEAFEGALGRPIAAVAAPLRVELAQELSPGDDVVQEREVQAAALEHRRSNPMLDRLVAAWSSTGAGNARSLAMGNSVAEMLAALEASLAREDDPERRLFAGEMYYVLSDQESARRHFQSAFRIFTEAGDPRGAARAASSLGYLYIDGFADAHAGRAWLTRAERLVEPLPPCVEQGWVAVALIGCSVADTGALKAHATLALERARHFGDMNLEARAMAELGLALVSLGQVREGLASLDEAMALATSEAVNPQILPHAACCMVSACARAGDLARAESWIHAWECLGGVDQNVPIGASHCASTYGTVLFEVGRLPDAERALDLALEAGRASCFVVQVRARVAMAELRIRQGRLEDAEQLLRGLDDRFEALVPTARLHLARGEHDLAGAVARRGLRMLGGDRAHAIPLMAIGIDAALAQGDLATAAKMADDLMDKASNVEQAFLVAEAILARARVDAARGEHEAAVARLYRALGDLGSTGLPLQRAAMHLELAMLQADTDRPAALSEARAARALHARLGTVEPPAITALLGS